MSLDDAGPTPVRPLMALRALLALSQNPQDTTQVFRLGEAIKGRSPFKLLARFRSDPLGRQVLQERRPLLDTLVRTDWLQSLPPGSMGRVYHDFLAEQGLSAQGLVDLSRAGGLFMADDGSDRYFIGQRLRDIHDLMHVLTGYGRDELGELCVLAFSYPHQYTRSFAVLAILGALAKRRLLGGTGVRRAIFQAWRDGRRATWLLVQPLETLLAQDLGAVRRRLNILAPQRYLALTDRLRAQGRDIPPPPGRDLP
jgi:ubiquinone biosynthesis protein COQ4